MMFITIILCKLKQLLPGILCLDDISLDPNHFYKNNAEKSSQYWTERMEIMMVNFHLSKRCYMNSWGRKKITFTETCELKT